ncbi:MAG TPA: hypothetical protein VGA01_10130 [Candidatus Binatia bacterium]
MSQDNIDRQRTAVNTFRILKVDVLVNGTLPAILAAKQATKTIPIVIVTNMDPSAVQINNTSSSIFEKEETT